MTREDIERYIEKISHNELYQKSKSVHKGFQFRQFFDQSTSSLMEGVQIRYEDANLLVAGQLGFDPASVRKVKYNFKNGVLHSENNEPAVEYEGHREFWTYGILTKVIDDASAVEEEWKKGVPVVVKSTVMSQAEA